MAARLSPKHDAKTREKIQTSQLVNRLNNFVLGGVDPKTKQPIEMSTQQVTVALGLLRKVLPDLQAVEHSGDVTTHYVAQLPEKQSDVEAWVNQVTEQNRANGSNGKAH